MPHKHKRKRDESDRADFDLPPTAQAAPLPAHRPKAVVALDDEGNPARSNKRRKPSKAKSNAPQSKVVDDTPKQFARMMAYVKNGKRIPTGLDDGTKNKKKQKEKKEQKQKKTPDDPNKDKPESATTTTANDTSDTTTTALKIRPGERLADFALRVDQTLPLSSVPRYSTKQTQLTKDMQQKAYLTKHNKRLARMQSQWREDEERLKTKRAEADEDALEQREEDGMLWMDVDEARKSKKGKKGKREGDIWDEVKKKRKDAGGGGGLGGLNAGTAAQAPPVLKGVKNMFKEKRVGGATSVAIRG